ncbi:hypothetical protein Tco_0966108 [Tanacetum coccineum]
MLACSHYRNVSKQTTRYLRLTLEGFPFVTVNTKEYHSKCSGKISRILLIMEYLVNISKRRAFWTLNKDILKITVLTTNTPYLSRKIQRICACTHQRPRRPHDQYAISREDQYAVLEIYNDINIELSKEFLEELQTNAYHGWIDKDVMDHNAKMNESWNKRRMDDSILTINNTTTDSFFKPYLITRGKGDTEKKDEQSQTKRKCSNTSNSIDEQPYKRICKA